MSPMIHVPLYRGTMTFYPGAKDLKTLKPVAEKQLTKIIFRVGWNLPPYNSAWYSSRFIVIALLLEPYNCSSCGAAFRFWQRKCDGGRYHLACAPRGTNG